MRGIAPSIEVLIAARVLQGAVAGPMIYFIAISVAYGLFFGDLVILPLWLRTQIGSRQWPCSSFR